MATPLPARRKRSSTTLKEVAGEAGVSIAAVSKVLHGRGSSVRVGLEKSQDIRDAARKLNYVPNILARSLRTNLNDTIGLVFENFGAIADGPQFYVQLLDGLASTLFANHVRLTILPEVDHKNPLASIGDGRLDGIIWCKMPGSPEFLEQIAQCPIPCVALHAPPPDRPHNIVFVSCDNFGGVRLGLQHLAELGHTDVGFVMEKQEEDTPDARARLHSFRTHMAASGRPTTDADVLTWNSDASNLKKWFDSKSGHTALFAWNEFMAGRILKQAFLTGISVPQQLSVVSFDSTPYSETTTPPLTAVRQPIRTMAGHAAQVLLDLVHGRQPSQFDQVFSCTLDVRDSTGPMPKSASLLRKTYAS